MTRRIKLSLAAGLPLTLSLGLAWAYRVQHEGASGLASGSSATNLPGQTATLLPDGRWLLIGGEASQGPQADAVIEDPQSGTTATLANRLNQARAWHTATLLPDGTVLIVGGVNADGQVLDSSELFDPEAQTFQLLTSTGLTSRAYHTATLLTDGRVLIAGGVSKEGEPLHLVELWDPRARTATVLPSELGVARRNHVARLLPDGTVLFWGGLDRNGNALQGGEVFDPQDQGFTPVESLPDQSQAETAGPRLAGSLPEDGAQKVPIDTIIGLRFSEPLDVKSVSRSTVTLSGPGGAVAAKAIPAEGGLLAFVTPDQKLEAGVDYILLLHRLRDRANRPVPDTEVRFATAGEAFDAEQWTPDSDEWKTWRPDSPWRSLPPLQALPGVTAIAGQVLRLNGLPLADATLQIDAKKARTDPTGRFLLSGISPGHHSMLIDGQTASRPGRTYGLFEDGVDVIGGRNNVLPYTIWMTRIDTEHAVTIPSPTSSEVTVTTPLIPGLEVHIPPKTVILDHDGNVVTRLSITPIPVDRPPFPLPVGVVVPLYFTVQPGSAYVKNPDGAGARIIYPNYTHLPPGTRVDFWNYDPDQKGWYVYGHGTVTPDGKQVVPDPGVGIYEFTGAMISGGGSPPGTWPPAGNKPGKDGEPVDLATGLFVLTKTDLFLPDILPLSLTRTYRPGDSASRAFGIGSTHPYEMFLYSVNNYQQADLILPDGGRIHYVRISAGTGYTDAVYQHTATPTVFYGSQIAWNGNGWNLTLKNGTVYVFGDNAPLQSIRDRYGNTLMVARAGGQTGNITQITSPNGRFIQFTYDSSNRITQAQDNNGRAVSYAYDATGRLSTVTDANGGVTTYTYDTASEMLTIQDARGITYLTNQYDANGRVTKQTQADGSTYQFAYTLDGNGNVTQTNVTDPRGNVRQVTFNSSGYTLTDTRAVGKPEQQAITYNRQTGSNLVLSVTDALNRQTAYAYDSMANVTSITRLSGTPNAVTTSLTYEPTFNQVTTVTDPLSHTTSFAYDTHGNLTSVTDPLGNQTSLAYNSLGQPVSVTDALSHTTQFTYDGTDLVGVTDPLGRTSSRFIDGAGRLALLTDPLGNFAQYSYDGLNQPTQVTDPSGNTASFAYDPNGNLLSVTDALNHVTNYSYDNMDRLASRKDPLLRVESFVYDADANLTRFTDRKAQATAFTYDGLNRRTKATYADNSTTTYTYDAGDRLTQAVDSVSGTISRTYDGLDRLTSEGNPQGSVSYAYDKAGRRTGLTVAGQPAMNYTYDNADRLTQITQGTSTVAFAYDKASRRTSLTLPNAVKVAYAYDGASELTGLTYTFSSTMLGTLTYGYDNASRRIIVGGSFARTGLPPAVSSASYDAANELSKWGTTNLTYDLNGNLTGDGLKSYTWNARNLLASISGGAVGAYQYDAFGRRIGNSGTGYVYDRVNPVQELSGGIPTANLLTGLGVDEVFTRTDSAGARHFLTDALGSTVALTDSSGTLQTQYTYEPFGNTTSSGAPSSSSYQYTGRENDGTGLYFYRARYYNPTLQRFISEDPIGFDGGINLYEYVDSNPLDLSDPSGLSSLLFDRDAGTLTVYDSDGNYVATYPAGNNATNSGGDPNTVGSNGPAPNGTYPVQAPIPTGNSPSFGPYFFPIGAPGSLVRRRGIGLHGGRRGPMSRTHGCIRVSNDTDRRLHQLNETDPVRQITIQ